MFPSQIETLISASKKPEFSRGSDLKRVGGNVSMHNVPQYQGMVGATAPVETNPGFQDTRNLRFGVMPSDIVKESRERTAHNNKINKMVMSKAVNHDFQTSIITPTLSLGGGRLLTQSNNGNRTDLRQLNLANYIKNCIDGIVKILIQKSPL
jgi:hypothetical protein